MKSLNNFEVVAMLPKVIQKNFIVAMIHIHGREKADKILLEHVHHENMTMYRFLSRHFDFMESPQGHEYWNKVRSLPMFKRHASVRDFYESRKEKETA